MRQNSFTPIFILALNSGSAENDQAILAANGLKGKHIRGVYTHTNGERVEEDSYIIAASETSRAKVMALAKAYDQESVLFSGIDRTAELIFTESGEVVPLGVLKPAMKGIAVGKTAYSYDPESGKYFIVE